MMLHGSCVALDEDGVLILGPSGAGKSDLVLCLIRRGWSLVADDQVVLAVDRDALHGDVSPALRADAPPALRGMLEVRGLGLFRDLPAAGPRRLHLVVRLDAAPARLPEPAWFPALGRVLPMVTLRGLEPSLPEKVALALEAATGRAQMAAGAFAA
jgi:HPr kinase/phosphorylase